MNLLEYIFSSNAPLTDTFLNRQSLQGVMKTCETLSPDLGREIDESEGVITFSAIVRKHDMKVLYVECGEDFVDLLFSFLAVPLESVINVSGDSSTFGCIGNLFKSFKVLSATEVSTSKAVLPHYYTCQKQLLNIIIEQPQSFHRISTKEPLALIDSKSHGGDQSSGGSGFMKRDAKFTVSDDLIITPMTSSSAICILKKLESRAKDIQVQEIRISKKQVYIDCGQEETCNDSPKYFVFFFFKSGNKFVESFLGDILCTERCIMELDFEETQARDLKNHILHLFYHFCLFSFYHYFLGYYCDYLLNASNYSFN